MIISGLGYRCLECPKTFLYSTPAVEHSYETGHAVMETTREDLVNNGHSTLEEND